MSFKKILIHSLLFLMLLFVASPVFADPVGIFDPLQVGSFCGLLKQLSTSIIGVVAALSGIMIIIAGIMYLLSAGSQEKMGIAKRALTYAIWGIILSILAYPIVNIITETLKATGVNACN